MFAYGADGSGDRGGRLSGPPAAQGRYHGGPRTLIESGRPVAGAAAGGAATADRPPGTAASPSGGARSARGRDVAGWTRAARGPGRSACTAARAAGGSAHFGTCLRGCAVALGAAVASVSAATRTTKGRRRVMLGSRRPPPQGSLGGTLELPKSFALGHLEDTHGTLRLDRRAERAGAVD